MFSVFRLTDDYDVELDYDVDECRNKQCLSF